MDLNAVQTTHLAWRCSLNAYFYEKALSRVILLSPGKLQGWAEMLVSNKARRSNYMTAINKTYIFIAVDNNAVKFQGPTINKVHDNSKEFAFQKKNRTMLTY